MLKSVTQTCSPNVHYMSSRRSTRVAQTSVAQTGCRPNVRRPHQALINRTCGRVRRVSLRNWTGRCAVRLSSCRLLHRRQRQAGHYCESPSVGSYTTHIPSTDNHASTIYNSLRQTVQPYDIQLCIGDCCCLQTLDERIFNHCSHSQSGYG